MNTLNPTLRNAVATALALSCGTAFAYVPTSNTDADHVIYWGGATASTISAQELTINAVCDADPHILYVRAGSGANPDAAGNDWAVACKTAAAGATKTGLGNNKRILVIKRDRDGSGVGVGPVQTKTTDGANQGKITFQNFATANCPFTPTPGVSGAPVVVFGGGNVPLVGCNVASTTLAYAEMGTSDIEANKFIGINTPKVDGTDFPYSAAADRKFEEEFSLAALIFNNPVTLELYKVLQKAQFATTSVCHPTNASYTAATADGTDRADITNADSEACMPSLTRAQINGLLTGQIFSWDQLLDSAGNPLAFTPMPAAFGGSTDLTVQVCRRVNGSGTQATINFWDSSYACDPDKTDQSTDIITPLTSATPGVYENSGSGDVSNCMRDINNRTGSKSTAPNPYAIGNLSVEGRNVDYTLPWRYIKIDGVSPTLANVHTGKYTFWAQQACQRRKETLPYNAGVTVDDTVANKKKIFDALCSPAATNGLNSLATLTKLNNEQNAAQCAAGTLNRCGSFYKFGRAGWLATPTATLLYDNVLAATTRPVNAWTREVATGKPNVCQTPVRATEGDNLFNGVVVQ